LAMLKFHFETFFHIQKHKSYGHLNFWCRKFWRPISREDEGQGNLKFWFWQFFWNVNKCANISWIWNCAVRGAVRLLLFSFSADHLVYVSFWLLWTIDYREM
jgi:hypothetical protein